MVETGKTAVVAADGENGRVIETDKTELALRATTAIAAGLAGAVDPSLGLLAAGAKEIVDPALAGLGEKIRQAHRRRLGRLWQAGCDESGLEPETLGERLARDEPALLLTAEAVEASIRTAVPEKIGALGRVLANAVHDTAKVDEELLVVRALAQIEAPHISLLALLADEPPLKVVQGHEARVLGWTPDQIASRLPGHSEVLDPLLVTLQSSGLIEAAGSDTTWDGSRLGDQEWAATRFGRLCLQRLDDARGRANLDSDS
ncbi:hypothetical protein [Micromonospora viridifaciens]|uniref:hypothetical protein n=1 Tax=Micromonospora viridifaciens TaxID=1881 RepID=UPI0012FE0059|nr:hypothetical protein [Micromonospora viridifaciens]